MNEADDRVRLAGTLAANERGMLLRAPDGMWWKLIGDAAPDTDLAGSVTIEGIKRGPSTIEVYYCQSGQA
ncbi:DUF5818 domain-containing protein [Sphingomonas xinjiangensis]|uniref:Uncharacterized protein n=1 Tax=Sphingomonas xinjiangensis TaxID=643568 RepID=A0A840YSS3_9SPHN|nr:DUF5818 domain-containing protein [Sphingomonas xinjiangensis]MBB5712746.1 hypothetical protein [Sphingomonas xinjiangensis]